MLLITSYKKEMIKLENVVLASPDQMEFIIEGMRMLPVYVGITAPLYW